MAYEKTINLTGTEACVKIEERNCDIRNDSAATLYVSRSADIVPDADEVLSIPPKQAVKYCGLMGAVYLLGTGKVQICGNNSNNPLFKCAATSSGEGGGTGADGKSAYEVAVANGFEGSVAEWLASLQGETGPQGESAVSAITPRGDYDAAAAPAYTTGDYITHTDGNTYVCKVDNPTNAAPTDGTMADPFWQLIALRGAQGPAGADGKDATINGVNALTIAAGTGIKGVQSGTTYALSLDSSVLSNPNLLDNWYLTDPINQRGQTEYTERGYTVDRWFKNTANTVRITGNGTQLVERGSLIRQKIAPDLEDFLIGKVVTLTVLLSDGSLLTVSEIFPNKVGVALGAQENIGMSFYWDEAYQNVVFTAQEANVNIKAAKLELGSIQTLAHKDIDGNWMLNDPPPNPAVELAKCQRYYIPVSQYTRVPSSRITSSEIDFVYFLPTTMRILPSIDFTKLNVYTEADVLVDGFTFSAPAYMSGILTVRATKENHGLTSACLSSRNNGTLAFSADL